MNYDVIYQHFLDSEYDVQPLEYSGQSVLSVAFEANNEIVTLVHFPVSELQVLPQFYLLNHKRYGTLAHVLGDIKDSDLGSVCVNHLDSVSVNFERPELAFEESIKRHIVLLRSVMEAPEHNQQELLREFRSNWHHAVSNLWRTNARSVYVSPRCRDFEQLKLYKPVQSGSYFSIPSSHVAMSALGPGAEISDYFRKEDRDQRSNALCFVIPLETVDTHFPTSTPEFREWLLNMLATVDNKTRDCIHELMYGPRTKEFWLIFNLPTPSGVTWFGVRLAHDHKKPFPNTIEKMSGWKIEPLLVESFSKERVMPRSGAICELSGKKVLLVGCGSVGSELADKLGAAGIGNIDICDPDRLSVANIYRHTLNQNFIDRPKSISVAFQLSQKYPWIKAQGFSDRVLDIRQKDLASKYDLIIVAIGSPTHERLFHEYLIKNKLKLPVVYVWLEGYGIGGHAILDIPDEKGCLRCAYIDAETGRRGLASNLNFLQSNQHIVKNYAGCGEMFIPYGAVSSAQTALIAADLAISYLGGKQKTSSKVSWKGSRSDVDAEGLTLTRRYAQFNASLKPLPLYHPVCDSCGSQNTVIFSHQDIQLSIPKVVLDQLSGFRQLSSDQPEAAGLLIGYADVNGDITIDSFTMPKPTDTRKRAYFKLDAECHQQEIDLAFDSSDGILGYFGTWHTHPQNIPEPSGVDIVDWKKHDNENAGRQLFFIVIGIEKTAVFTILDGKTVELVSTENRGKYKAI